MFFKKIKFIKEVYKEINLFIEMAEIPRTTETLKEIIKETEKNSGETWDPAMDWHLFMAEQIHPVAYEHRNYLYKTMKGSPKKSAIYSISTFISYLADEGRIEEMRISQTDSYDSLKMLWSLCGYLATEPEFESEYADVVIVPRNGNPFE